MVKGQSKILAMKLVWRSKFDLREEEDPQTVN
jgi:hypothetical protein